MWAVWLGRHPVENISIGHKDKLIQGGNLELSVRAKVYLTVSLTVKDAETKVGSSEHLIIFNRLQI